MPHADAHTNRSLPPALAIPEIQSRKTSALWWWAGPCFRILLVLATVFVAGFIAKVTQFNAHPDEFVHVDAFEYFRAHWFRPATGSPLVYYSVNGWSRVFTGEIVYLLYGKTAAMILHFWPTILPLQIYRFCNVALLMLTLSALMATRCRLFKPWLLAMVLISVPQAIYIYAYANSDAFGISADLLLLLQAARMLDRKPQQWTLWTLFCFWFLLTCTLLSKTPFLIGIILPSVLLLTHIFSCRPNQKFLLTRLIVPLLTVYILAACWDPLLSPWHSHWRAEMRAMQQDKAVPGRKPKDDAQVPGIYLAEHNWTYEKLLSVDDYNWWRTSGQSFYGEFGYMTIALPMWMYATAGYASLGLLLLTILSLIIYRTRVWWALLLCIAAAPLLIAINLGGSMYHSLHFDFQPQGRYLFASLPVIFFLCFGTWTIEGRWWRVVRGMALMFFVSLSLYICLAYVAMASVLR